MRTLRLAMMLGALATFAVLAALTVTAGLGVAGWIVGAAAGVGATSFIVVARGRSGCPEILPADWITLTRATLIAGVAALVADSFRRPAPVTTLVVLATAALVLDAVDGQVARRTGTATPLGGRFDGEVDAFLILVLSVAVSRDYGAWVLAIGVARYALLVAGWVLPWLATPLPPRYWRKVVAAAQGITLTIAVSGVLPRPAGIVAVAAALLLLAESFGVDVLWLCRTHARVRGTESAGLRRRAWAWVRLLGGALVLAVVVQRVGAGPFLDGVRGLGPGTILVAVALGAAATIASAWRWRVVAGALGVAMPLRGATGAYYRSQLLNSTLPGGVLGDVHRGVRSGVDSGHVGLGVRAVVWERFAGQVVQVALALVVLLVLPSPVHAAMPAVAAALVLVAVALLVSGRGLRRFGTDRVGRMVGTVSAEVREGLLRPTIWPVVLLASLFAIGGHIGMFLLAAQAAGVHTSPQRMLPLIFVVLLAAAIPLNVGGWGPREGAAALVFAGAGFPAAAGAAVSTAFGVLTLLATLPGAVLLLVDWLRPRPSAVPSEEDAPAGAPAGAPPALREALEEAPTPG